MKRQYLTLLNLSMVSILILSSTQCTDLSPSDWSTISVYVYWQDAGLPDKKVEIMQTREIRYTDERGFATFTLAPGSYTVRVYGINRGGPVLLSYDFEVALKASESRKLDVFDCQACV